MVPAFEQRDDPTMLLHALYARALIVRRLGVSTDEVLDACDTLEEAGQARGVGLWVAVACALRAECRVDDGDVVAATADLARADVELGPTELASPEAFRLLDALAVVYARLRVYDRLDDVRARIEATIESRSPLERAIHWAGWCSELAVRAMEPVAMGEGGPANQTLQRAVEIGARIDGLPPGAVAPSLRRGVSAVRALAAAYRGRPSESLRILGQDAFGEARHLPPVERQIATLAAMRAHAHVGSIASARSLDDAAGQTKATLVHLVLSVCRARERLWLETHAGGQVVPVLNRLVELLVRLGWNGMDLVADTARQSMEHHALREESRTDPLTGVGNRRALDEELRQLVRFSPLPLSLVLIDVDDFKQVNDQFTHVVGDEVLRHVAHGLSQQLRGGDRLLRFGGDEFVALLPATGDQEAHRVAARMESAIKAIDWNELSKGLRVTVTTGSAALWSLTERRPDADAERLFQRADEALLSAKRRREGDHPRRRSVRRAIEAAEAPSPAVEAEAAVAAAALAEAASAEAAAPPSRRSRAATPGAPALAATGSVFETPAFGTPVFDDPAFEATGFESTAFAGDGFGDDAFDAGGRSGSRAVVHSPLMTPTSLPAPPAPALTSSSLAEPPPTAKRRPTPYDKPEQRTAGRDPSPYDVSRVAGPFDDPRRGGPGLGAAAAPAPLTGSQPRVSSAQPAPAASLFNEPTSFVQVPAQAPMYTPPSMGLPPGPSSGFNGHGPVNGGRPPGSHPAADQAGAPANGVAHPSPPHPGRAAEHPYGEAPSPSSYGQSSYDRSGYDRSAYDRSAYERSGYGTPADPGAGYPAPSAPPAPPQAYQTPTYPGSAASERPSWTPSPEVPAAPAYPALPATASTGLDRAPLEPTRAPRAWEPGWKPEWASDLPDGGRSTYGAADDPLTGPYLGPLLDPLLDPTRDRSPDRSARPALGPGTDMIDFTSGLSRHPGQPYPPAGEQPGGYGQNTGYGQNSGYGQNGAGSNGYGPNGYGYGAGGPRPDGDPRYGAESPDDELHPPSVIDLTGHGLRRDPERERQWGRPEDYS